MDAFQIVVEGKDTVLATHNARYEIALLIGIGHSLFVDDRLGRGREITPYRIETILYLRDFFHGDRRTSITLDTALALTDAQVTTEFLRQDL